MIPIYSEQETYVFDCESFEYENEVRRMLSENELPELKKISNPSRKNEWLAVRYIVYKLLGCTSEICYTQHGKPYFEHGNGLSISHSENLIAVKLGANVAVDIQKISPKIVKIASKFLTDAEILAIDKTHCPIEHYVLQWSAKEVLYKLYETGSLNFKSNLFVEIPQNLHLISEGKIRAEIRTSIESESFMLFFKKICHNNSDYMLVYS